jgi:hypothetical protein
LLLAFVTLLQELASCREELTMMSEHHETKARELAVLQRTTREAQLRTQRQLADAEAALADARSAEDRLRRQVG